MTPLERALPNLVGSGYRLTSPPDDGYNCIAWAATDAGRWWWPDAAGTAFWPAGVERMETLPAFVATFATLGFTPTDTSEPVAGVDKIAVYACGGTPTHMARQLPSGRWTSKLGSGPDIEHGLDDLTGNVYGTVAVILARLAQS